MSMREVGLMRRLDYLQSLYYCHLYRFIYIHIDIVNIYIDIVNIYIYILLDIDNIDTYIQINRYRYDNG